MNSSKKLCSINGCTREAAARTWCKTHWARWKRHGSTATTRNVEKHGLSEHHLYSTWHSMIQRCENINNIAYKNYGGRGIGVCSRWRNSFSSFIDDMGEKPSPKYTLDRIDNSGNYEPSNCRWSTRTEQNLNQRMRIDNTVGFVGVREFKVGKKRWQALISVNGKRKSLGYYFTPEDANYARMQFQIVDKQVVKK